MGFGALLLLFWTMGALAADPCLDNVPVPTVKLGLHRVVQLVNCSNQWILGTANAAHNAASPPTPVLPREGTWVMAPAPPPGSSSHANVLTIDIPLAWENTGRGGSAGPNFWARTGCRFDTVSGIAQCETGGCSGIYDCSKALKGPPYGATLAEWNFAQPVVVQGKGKGKGKGKGQGATYLIDNMDISAVNGVNLNLDIQPISGSTSDPTDPSNPQWLAQNYPLTIHGADLRTPGQGLGQCSPSFQLRRSDLTGYGKPPGQAIFAFVVADQNGIPQDPAGDAVVGCFSNCGKYGFPVAPDCSASPLECYYWKTFCLYLPGGAYNGTCQTDQDCTFKKTNYGISCFKDGPQGPSAKTGVCAGRGFVKTSPCPANVCTFQYGYQGSYAWQPPYGRCSDITGDPNACIGDDTVHGVMTKAYTWPNDPQVFGGDAPVYRIVFAPGGTPASADPITPSIGQGVNGSTSSGIPLCSSLPGNYNYAAQYSGPGPSPQFCTKPCDGQLNPSCPGFKPPAAGFAVAFPGSTAEQPWACNFNPAGGGGSNGVVCRWQ